MLNKELFLNENLFEISVEKIPTRDGYGDALLELGEKNKDIVVLTADLADSTRVEKFRTKYPDRFFDCGVAEQNMISVAAGLGVNGKRVFTSSYATFSPGKNWETIRTTVAYNEADVKIAGHHAGLMTAQDGATHQATEDIALTRVIPLMKVLSPCDYWESIKVTKKAGEEYGPFYLRFTREKTPVITTERTPFVMGENYKYWVGKSPQCVIFATGYILYYALIAANTLKQLGIEVDVVNVSSIKPMNIDTIVKYVKGINKVVCAEDHQIAGGMGSLISEILSQYEPSRIEFVGLKDNFGESGTAEELIKKFEIDDIGIIKSVKKLLEK